MNTQGIVVLCIALLVVGGGAWYFMQPADDNVQSATSNTTDDTQTTDDRTVTEVDETFSGTGSIVDLMARNESVRCDFSVNEANESYTGTSYIDGRSGRYRVDATYAMNDERGTFNAITAERMMYWWGTSPEGESMAMMMTLPEDESTTADTSQFDASTQISPEQDLQYECARWSVDDAIFTPPTDVEFTDMDAMMRQMMGGVPEGYEIPEEMREMMQQR